MKCIFLIVRLTFILFVVLHPSCKVWVWALTSLVTDGHRKAELLKLIAQVEKVDLQQTIAVGDGANDLPMLSQAGLGIAFHAKPRVVANAQQSINTIGLDGVLYFLGFKDSYLDEKAQ